MIFSTHVMQHAERLCDQVVLIAGGKKMFDGTVAEAACVGAARRLVLEGEFGPDALAGAPGLAGVDGRVPRRRPRAAHRPARPRRAGRRRR